MNPRHKADSLKKKALDALLEMYSDPDRAIHQQHSDPGFTTQTGKDYAGRGTTEPEDGVSVTIPPQDIRAAMVETDPKLAPPEGIEDAEFFKESDPEMNPVEEEIEAHAFFKEAPEYEMRRASAGQIPYAVKKAAMCECGHPFEIHSKPPDFGCPHEKDGCGCKGATEKKAAVEDEALIAQRMKESLELLGRHGEWLSPTDKRRIKSEFLNLIGRYPGIAAKNKFSEATLSLIKMAGTDETSFHVVAEKYGVDFKGVTTTPQTADNQYIIFNDPVSGTQFGLFVDEFSEDLFVERLSDARKRFDMPGTDRLSTAEYREDGKKADGSPGIISLPNASFVSLDALTDKEAADDGFIDALRQKQATATKLYHVTHTSKVPSIKAKGILPLQESNWAKAETGERYGEGEIFAFTDPNDAVRWAGKMDWEFNQGMGTGKISIVSFRPGKEEWKIDDADPMGQAANRGQWVKAHGSIKPEQIVAVTPVTLELTRAVVKNQPIKLASSLLLSTVRRFIGEPLLDKGQARTALVQALKIPDYDFKLKTLARKTLSAYDALKMLVKIDRHPGYAKAWQNLLEEQNAYKEWGDYSNALQNLRKYVATLPLDFPTPQESHFDPEFEFPVAEEIPTSQKPTMDEQEAKMSSKLGGQKEKFESLNRKWMLAFKRLDSMADRDVTMESLRKDAALLRGFLKEVTAFVESSPKGTLLRDAFIETKGIDNWLREADERLHVAEVYIENKNEGKADYARAEIMRAANRVYSVFLRLSGELNDMEMERELRGYYAPTASTTKSYGEMDMPPGGVVNNPNAPPEDDDEKIAAEETELAAEEARIVAEIEASDKASISKSASLAANVDYYPVARVAYKLARLDDAGWFAKSARPTEQKIELLQKQFKVTPEQIELAIAADPSPNQSDYVAWIAKWFSKGSIRLPEDTAKIKDQLATFTKLKRSPAFTHNKDIQQYDPAKLFEVLEAGSTAPALSKKEQEREAIAKGSKIVVNQDGLTIYKVTDSKALSLLSGGTNWCTAHENWGSKYLKDGPSYVIFEDGSAFAQFHPASDQLMNRQDVCMLERVYGDKPRTRGWGRSAPKAELIASFITDQTLLRALQLLSAVDPGVERWVKENTSDPEQLVKILGEKAAEEQRKNEYESGYSYYGEREKSWRMTVQHALASGQQLNPGMEAKLEKGVSTDLLFKYGARFHAGQPWEPLAKAILAQKGVSKEILDYAVKFANGRWPEGETKLLKGAMLKTYGAFNMKLALEYAQRVVKGRWPELEAKFHKAKPSEASGYGSAEYAINILKQRWTEIGVKPRKDGKINEEEIIIVGAPGEAQRYAATFMPGQRWAEFEQSALGANHLSALTDYAMNVVKGRMPEVEQAILSGKVDSQTRGHYVPNDLALDYANKVLKARWPEYEREILGFIKSHTVGGGSKTYTPNNYGGSAMYNYRSARLPNVVENYIEQMLKGRWPELEQVLLARYQERPADWTLNQTFLDGYLRTLREICEKKYESQLKAVDNTDDRTTQLSEELNDFEAAHNQAKKEVADKEREILGKDAQCVWPEGEQRLRSRDENYEQVLLQEFKERNDKWHAETMEKDNDEKYINYKGYWVTWFGNREIEEYVQYLDSVGQNWPFGDELMDIFADIDDERNKEYSWHQSKPRRTRPIPEPQPVTSSLLKKAIVPIHEDPKLLPPREQFRKHIDPEAENSAMEGVMDGVKQPLDGKPQPRQKPQHEQFDPSLAGNDELAVMNQDMPEGFPQIAAESLAPRACPECGSRRFYNLAQETDNYDRYRCLDCKHEWELVPRKAEIMPERMGNWKLYAWPAGTVQFGQYGEIKRPAPKGRVWYVGDKEKALPILKENWDLSHEQENRLLEHGALDLPDAVLRLTNVNYYAQPQKFRNKLLNASAEKEAKPLRRAFLPAALLDLSMAPGAASAQNMPADQPKATKKYDPKNDPANISRMEIEPADEAPEIPRARKSPRVDSRYLLNHKNRFDPNIFTPEQLIEKGVLRGLNPVVKASLLAKEAGSRQEAQEFARRLEAETDEAYRAFLREPYVLQEAQDRNVPPEELWKEIGKEYANEYFVALKDREPQDWHAWR